MRDDLKDRACWTNEGFNSKFNNCVVCGALIKGRSRRLCCSDACQKINKRLMKRSKRAVTGYLFREAKKKMRDEVCHEKISGFPKEGIDKNNFILRCANKK